jgi:hypothetical protein
METEMPNPKTRTSLRERIAEAKARKTKPQPKVKTLKEQAEKAEGYADRVGHILCE